METEIREKPVLNIENGMIFDAVMSDEQVLFSGKVDEYDGDTLYLLDPDGGDVPPISFGSEVKLRCELPDERIAVYHGTILGSRSNMWKVGELCDWYGWNRRNFYRQPIAVEAKVLRLKRANPASYRELDMKVSCKLLDISGGGLLLACSKAVFEVGDQIQVSDIKVLPNEKPFLVLCSVKRIEKARFNNIFGCQFIGLDEKEQDRLVRAVFRLQVEERRKRAED